MVDNITRIDTFEQVANSFAEAINKKHYIEIDRFICEDTKLQTITQLIIQGKTIVLDYWAKKIENSPVMRAEVVNTKKNNHKIVLLNSNREDNAINQPLWEIIFENGRLTLLRETHA